MSQPLVTVLEDDLVAVAMQRMERAGIRRLVVLNGAGQLAGLLTRHDVVKALQAHYVDVLQNTVERLEQDLDQARHRLESVEHRLLERSVMNQVNDTVLVVDMDSGRIVEANDQAGDLLGYSHAELLELSCPSLVELCGGGEGWPAWAATFVRRGLQIEETRCRRSDQRWFPAEISLRHVVGVRGSYLVAVLRDITRRREAEARIRLDREQQGVLREILEIGIGEGSLEQRLGSCLDRLLGVSWLTLLPSGGIFRVDAEGLRLLVSRNFLRRFAPVVPGSPWAIACAGGRRPAARPSMPIALITATTSTIPA
jgi:PAS domain S-box-containing protein